ncbi:glycosyl transferase family protein [Calothrix sp. NIES-4071]|nr:glycosyl transferase family protein [Calothrix sp. NIES-4071]BAZ56056.1 glycosyl transferase family protein [Calothrix sp. NIES-4105]
MSILVSVIIPTKNGEEFLDEVLQATLSQQTDFDYEVIVIDSGSKDNSLEIIKKYDVKLIEIHPSEFNHGATRNFGIANSQGDFIAFLTQDATPANNQWLQNIVAPMREREEIAGVFGQHLPRKDCDPIVALNLKRHFDSFSLHRTCWQKDEGYQEKQGVYIFFSNNNSCIRRSVWEKIPFQRVEMSEDQWWAKDIIENGYVKCYEPDALVYHSHTYTPLQWMKRQFDEYKAYKKIGVVEKLSIRSYMKIFAGLSYGDARQLLQMKELSYWSRAYWILQRTLNNLGIVVGQYYGANYNNIPSYVSRKFLSEQARKQEV